MNYIYSDTISNNIKKVEQYILVVYEPQSSEKDKNLYFEKDFIACLLIEKEEYYEKDDLLIIREAYLKLSYKVLFSIYSQKTKSGSFQGGYYNYSMPQVSITSSSPGIDGFVLIEDSDLREKRIGTYLMNEVVSWAKQWPEAKVKPVKLYKVQATNDNKARRNRFYERFGLVFEYSDSNKSEGKSNEMFASELIEVDTWRKNIKKQKINEFLCDILRENRRYKAENKRNLNEIKRLNKSLDEAREHPFAWCLQYGEFGIFMKFLIFFILWMAKLLRGFSSLFLKR